MSQQPKLFIVPLRLRYAENVIEAFRALDVLDAGIPALIEQAAPFPDFFKGGQIVFRLMLADAHLPWLG